VIHALFLKNIMHKIIFFRVIFLNLKYIFHLKNISKVAKFILKDFKKFFYEQLNNICVQFKSFEAKIFNRQVITNNLFSNYHEKLFERTFWIKYSIEIQILKFCKYSVVFFFRILIILFEYILQ
jgi:hypothetical protein